MGPGERCVTSQGTLKVLPVIAIVLLAGLFAVGGSPAASADCEEELALVREELNQTRAALDEVNKERDEYGQRLEDQTMVLIVALILLLGSFMVFYVAARRQRIAIIELENRLGVDIIARPRKRTRRKG